MGSVSLVECGLHILAWLCKPLSPIQAAAFNCSPTWDCHLAGRTCRTAADPRPGAPRLWHHGHPCIPPSHRISSPPAEWMPPSINFSGGLANSTTALLRHACSPSRGLGKLPSCRVAGRVAGPFQIFALLCGLHTQRARCRSLLNSFPRAQEPASPALRKNSGIY